MFASQGKPDAHRTMQSASEIARNELPLTSSEQTLTCPTVHNVNKCQEEFQNFCARGDFSGINQSNGKKIPPEWPSLINCCMNTNEPFSILVSLVESRRMKVVTK